MNWRSIWAIARKDLKEVSQNKAAWMPAVIVPVIFAIVFPVILVILPQVLPVEDIQREMGDIQQLIEMLPPQIATLFAGLSLEQAFILYMIGIMLAPMFLIMPLMFSSIVGAESFVGERERKTMEALLYTPASDSELFLGKVLAAVVPAIAISWITYSVYIVVVNAASFKLMGGLWFPLPTWWPLMFWVTPAFALLGISATVLVSSRTRTFMEAYQLSGSLVVLVLAIVIGQVTGVIALSVLTGMLIGTVIWAIGGVLLFFSIRLFRRSQLIAKL